MAGAVETIVRLARVARNAPGVPSDLSVLALVQITAELDEVYMPVNTRGCGERRRPRGSEG